MADDRLTDLLLGDVRGVLRADQDGVDAFGLAVAVFDGHLALAVRAQPGQGAILAQLRQAAGELVGQVDGQRHQLGRLVAGKAEHHALVAGADGLDIDIRDLAAPDLQGLVDAHGNIAGLLGDGDLHAAGIAIEALLAVVVADVENDLAHQLIEIDVGAGGDLAQQHDKAGLGGAFARHARHGILLQAGIQHAVADLVAELVGVTLGDRFGREQQAGRTHKGS